MGKEEKGPSPVQKNNCSGKAEPMDSVRGAAAPQQDNVIDDDGSKECEDIHYDTKETYQFLETIKGMKDDPQCVDCQRGATAENLTLQEPKIRFVMCSGGSQCFCEDWPMGHAQPLAKSACHPVALWIDQPDAAYCFKCDHSLSLKQISLAARSHKHGYVVRGMPNRRGKCYANALVHCLPALEKLWIRRAGTDACATLNPRSGERDNARYHRAIEHLGRTVKGGHFVREQELSSSSSKELLFSRGAYADPLCEAGTHVRMPNNVLDTRQNAPLLIGMELPFKNVVLYEDEPETEGDATCKRMVVGGVKRSFHNPDTKWVLDSGSSYHITGNKCWLKETSEIEGNRQLQFSVASGNDFCPTHEGKLRTDKIKLSGVYFIEGCSMNIISAGMLEAQGLQIDFGDGKFTVRNPKSSVLVGEGYLDRQAMRYVVNNLNFKDKYISEPGSLQEIAEASTVITPEVGVETSQRNLKRKREETEDWIVDSGNAHHLTSTVNDMAKLHSVVEKQISLDTPLGNKIKITKEGNKRSSTIRLNRVWYSPHIAHNLISVPQLDLEGYRVRLLSGVCTFWYKKKPEAVGTALCDAGNHLYYAREFRAVSQQEQNKYA